MSETLILHHRYTSPYSEKVRQTLGLTNISWHSVHAPFYPPRPALDPFLGGYRRIPVAHIGADFFCDSRLICDEIARLSDKPECSPYTQTEEIQTYLEEIESTVFYNMLGSIPVKGALKAMVKVVPPRHWLSYLKDKKAIKAMSPMEFPEQEQAAAGWLAFLQDLDQRLYGVNHLFDAPAPTIADLTAAEFIWWRQQMEGKAIFEGFKHISAWFKRVSAVGHGKMVKIRSADAIAAANASRPRLIPEAMKQSDLIGTKVAIKPTETMPIASEGILVGEDEQRWILARESDFGNIVHLHFPKVRLKLTQV